MEEKNKREECYYAIIVFNKHCNKRSKYVLKFEIKDSEKCFRSLFTVEKHHTRTYI